MAKTGIVVKQFLRKYGAVIFFPTFTASTILADLNHTRNWKREQEQLKKESIN
ncbi:uncharacterized protein LOC129613243 [Condylostylus longicornis]|uniref:uncharacterized protein LOC129613243 n=1 Tax=Condylostylus longicornis TaxID=2530218 RepID=UPI00244E3C7E|nr:uncharacterized protein LOC129613243 [Condylostylus longicornis]XP_055383203.1 uncharacterized protein LOC129613243 [Condylostylus longicornis]